MRVKHSLVVTLILLLFSRAPGALAGCDLDPGIEAAGEVEA